MINLIRAQTITKFEVIFRSWVPISRKNSFAKIKII